MRWKTCWYLIQADVYRASGQTGTKALLRAVLTGPPSRVLFVYRVGAWARSKPKRHRFTRLWTALVYGRWSAIHGIEIPFATVVGPGLRINHRIGGVIVNERARLGGGITLAPGVVIGNNTPDPTAPILGDRVVVHVGAKVIGAITIGADTRIGANAVVIRDLPAGVVAAGVPAKVIEGRESMASDRIDWERVLGPAPDDLP